MIRFTLEEYQQIRTATNARGLDMGPMLADLEHDLWQQPAVRGVPIQARALTAGYQDPPFGDRLFGRKRSFDPRTINLGVRSLQRWLSWLDMERTGANQ